MLSRVFGSQDFIESALEVIDETFDGEESKHLKASQKGDVLKAYEPFKVSQRILAFSFTFFYLVALGSAAMMKAFAVGDPDVIFTAMDNAGLDMVMLAIVTFYFGGGALESLGRARKNTSVE
ncbi:hypothetical protein [Solemya elarraichensis gill symbiont]|uniref:Uncharacterized protein n=1 Tax=Solemya elarraichensis gill symbiont TaxID=1918949 RepID=A0A1T2KYS2_9GAMM|nr:hypothetical protein [Solemya elarraichensis gill symbiont]OOZ37934.1 hypothetical protein BOW52_09925 [Solemya elarraichensis gill symbiont]